MNQLVFDQFSSNVFVIFVLSSSILLFFISAILLFIELVISIEIVNQKSESLKLKIFLTSAVLSFAMILISAKVIGSDYREISADPESYFDLIRNDDLLEFESKDDRLQSTTLLIEEENFNTIYARSKKRNKVYSIDRAYLTK